MKLKHAMSWIVLTLVMVSSTGQEPIQITNAKQTGFNRFMSLIQAKRCEPKAFNTLQEVKNLLTQSSVGLSQVVVSKVLAALTCAKALNHQYDNILTVIDYSLPSNQKRLWVFDLNENKMLFHTYVSHGIASGALYSEQFSNQYNSKASSIGVYKTEDAYYGRHGLSLKLNGLEHGFNSNASNRAVVMHSAWYVDEEFIKKYGRPGRSWGCPAIAENMKESVIHTIKGNGLLVIYYPEEKWVLHSRYLNCNHFSPIAQVDLRESSLKKSEDQRENVLFIDKHHHQISTENDPILVMPADEYEKIFQKKAPLVRMLRCQINHHEYIALSDDELLKIATENNQLAFEKLDFVTPSIKNDRGYYKTEMNFLNLGKIRQIMLNQETHSFMVLFHEHSPVQLISTNQFIRWLGL